MRNWIKIGLTALGVAAMATGACAQDWTPPGRI